MYNLEDRKMKEINYRIITLALLSVLFFMPIHAQNCQPSGTYTDASGEKNTIAAGDTYAASAPLSVSFAANPVAGINPNTRYEWHFFAQDNPRNALLVRYEENTDYTFTKAGTTLVYLYEILDGDTTRYDAINISISESSLLLMVTASMMCIERSQGTRVSWNLGLLSSTDGDRSSTNGPTRQVDGMVNTKVKTWHKALIS